MENNFSLDMNAYDLTVDSLDCHADKNIYHRFGMVHF